MARTPVTDKVADATAELAPLVAQEMATLWQQGDALVKWALSDEELGKVAQRLQLKASTLRKRENISREFAPKHRDSRFAWTVYAELVRLPGADARNKLLNSRTEWTVEDMKEQVNLLLMQQSGLSPRAVVKSRSGMKLGNVRVTGEIDGDDIVITIEAQTSDGKVIALGKNTVISASLDI